MKIDDLLKQLDIVEQALCSLELDIRLRNYGDAERKLGHEVNLIRDIKRVLRIRASV